MSSLPFSDAVYLVVLYSLMAVSAVTWIILLEATVSRDRVAL
jgi:hypothetical protein